MRRARVLLLVVAVLAAMVSTSGASYANTKDGFSSAAAGVIYKHNATAADCPDDYVCLWEDINYVGFLAAFEEGVYHPDFVYIACNSCQFGTFDNDATSWWNRTDRNYCVSWYANGGDPDNTMPVGSFGSFTTTGWNDASSSIGFLGCP